jgi:hypothetical protein
VSGSSASASSGSIPRPKAGPLQPRAQLNCARDGASVQPLQTGQSRRAPGNVSSTKAAAKAPKIDLVSTSLVVAQHRILNLSVEERICAQGRCYPAPVGWR